MPDPSLPPPMLRFAPWELPELLLLLLRVRRHGGSETEPHNLCGLPRCIGGAGRCLVMEPQRCPETGRKGWGQPLSLRPPPAVAKAGAP